MTILRLLKYRVAGILKAMSTKSFIGMLLALLVLLLSSCTMESQVPLSPKTYEFPDISLTGATYVLGRGGEQNLTVKADEIAIYEKANKAEITRLQFFQTDESGEDLLTGKADFATVNTESYDATLFGNIQVVQKEEDFTIEAEQLIWLHDEQVILSAEGEAVRILFDGGQTLLGSGFKGNLKTGLYEFTGQTEGVLLK